MLLRCGPGWDKVRRKYCYRGNPVKESTSYLEGCEDRDKREEAVDVDMVLVSTFTLVDESRMARIQK